MCINKIYPSNCFFVLNLNLITKMYINKMYLVFTLFLKLLKFELKKLKCTYCYIFYRLKKHSPTRWSSKYLLIKNYIRIYDTPGVVRKIKEILIKQKGKKLLRLCVNSLNYTSSKVNGVIIFNA